MENPEVGNFSKTGGSPYLSLITEASFALDLSD